ncbi:ATP-binding protein [Pseudomonas sp. ODNR1LW]|nr:ATP-binding protein [Pseudomonas sp. ODNR1LW]
MDELSGVLFEDRFLERYAGAIITDPVIAIVELVANAWDAWATKVEITWPAPGNDVAFVISDNGKGMTEAEFLRRWRKLDYDKIAEEGGVAYPPADMGVATTRKPYGRNGRGRHAAFRFGNPYTVRTWKDGVEVEYQVRRGVSDAPFDLQKLSERLNAAGHGTRIEGPAGVTISLTAQNVREELGTRFLSDPNFSVVVDGAPVTFDDVPGERIQEIDLPVDGLGVAKLIVIDTQKADKSTRQHGIAWWVDRRLVGSPGWSSYQLDGRTSEAKRFIFIVQADFLADLNAPLPDWTAFDPQNRPWLTTRDAVHGKIGEFLACVTEDRRREAKDSVREAVGATVAKLAPISRDLWNDFVDTVIDTCPSINTDEIEQVAKVLANLELSQSKYGLIDQLHNMNPADLDELHNLLNNWTVRTAKMALDEIQTRLKLIAELDRKLRDPNLSEVGDLQPLLERSLWVFGPEFESLEFTSNRGMTEVIQKLFGSKQMASRLRPDFAMVPDGSVGLYSRDSHDLGHEVDGVSRLVIAEIKRVGVPIGSDEKAQPWSYVKELTQRGLVKPSTITTCYVLGDKIEAGESEPDTKANGRVTIIPMTYSTFVRRAEKRMLGLRDKLRDAPFLQQMGIDTDAFVQPQRPRQGMLKLEELG